MRQGGSVGGKPGTVLIVDDEPRVLDGLRLALRPDRHTVMTAGSSEDALSLVQDSKFDVLIVDEHMPGGCGSDFIAQAYGIDPYGVRIVLSGRPTLEAALRAVNEGNVFRILCKPVPGDELRSVVRLAIHESRYLRRTSSAEARKSEASKNEDSSAAALRPFDAQSLEKPLGSFPPLDWAQLSAREKEVLAHLVDGWRVPQVGKRLFISVHTVRNHLKSIYRKLGLHSQQELIAHARAPARGETGPKA